MRQAFRVFDLDNDGLIDAQELKYTMRNLGEELSDDDVAAMISAADKNGDGKIDYEGKPTSFTALATLPHSWRRFCLAEFIKMMYAK